MVGATPGFQLAAGSAGRGLAGAAGNVLINGARPPAKAAPITQVLAAIPADEVRAVLLVPPGTMDVDMAGYPVLLYLITSTKQGLERSVTVTATDRGRLGRKIGGASWRERGCQEVAIQGVAAPVKK